MLSCLIPMCVQWIVRWPRFVTELGREYCVRVDGEPREMRGLSIRSLPSPEQLSHHPTIIKVTRRQQRHQHRNSRSFIRLAVLEASLPATETRRDGRRSTSTQRQRKFLTLPCNGILLCVTVARLSNVGIQFVQHACESVPSSFHNFVW